MSGDRELDCRIAETVFAWTDVERHPSFPGGRDPNENGAYDNVPHYSADIAEAMKVLDAWKEEISIERVDGSWIVLLYRQDGDEWQWLGRAQNASLPMAICLARVAQEHPE